VVSIVLNNLVVFFVHVIFYLEMATITSISYLFRSSGGVIGISATSAIFQGVVKKILTEKITGPDAEEVNFAYLLKLQRIGLLFIFIDY
jgi:hypothetical protein